jgi:hypothetical protein
LCALSLASALIAAAAPARSQPEPTAPPTASPECAAVSLRALGHLRAKQWVEAHLLAEVAAALCAGAERERAELNGAIALVRLEEVDRAAGVLRALRQSGDPATREAAATLESWALLAMDRQAFAAALERLPPEPGQRLRVLADLRAGDDLRISASRLEAGLQGQVAERYRRFRRQRSKLPWLAGSLSAILPGAGQLYAGSWEGAAVALVLNGLLVTATVELAQDQLYFAAGATGVAASVFYIGSIHNAVDLARRRNDRASEAEREALEHLLVPEAYP